METTTVKKLIKRDILGFTVPLLIGTILMMLSLGYSKQQINLRILGTLSPELLFVIMGFVSAFLVSNKAKVEPTKNKFTYVAFNSIYRVCYFVLFIGILSFYSFIPFNFWLNVIISIFIFSVAFFIWGIGRGLPIVQGEEAEDKDLLTQLEDSDSEKVATAILICGFISLFFMFSEQLHLILPETFKNTLQSQVLCIFFSIGLTFGALIIKINSLNNDYVVKEIK